MVTFFKSSDLIPDLNQDVNEGELSDLKSAFKWSI